jgi:hypothetical protein
VRIAIKARRENFSESSMDGRNRVVRGTRGANQLALIRSIPLK